MLLVALFSFALISPALASTGDAGLPACCRRTGKHHCSVVSERAPSQTGSGFRANNRCASYSRTTLSLGGSVSAFCLPISIPEPDRALGRGNSFTAAVPRLTPEGSHYDRGPPSLPFFIS